MKHSGNMNAVTSTSTNLTTRLNYPSMSIEFLSLSRISTILERYREWPITQISVCTDFSKSLAVSQWIEKTDVLYA